jgi:4-hydroxybutyrate dehydrogenase
MAFIQYLSATLNRSIGLPAGLAALGLPENTLERAGELVAATPFNQRAARSGTAREYAAIARAAFH